MQQQLQALEQSLAELKANNSTTKERPTAKKVQPARKNSVSSELKLNYNKIYDVLAKASKEDLRQFGQVWGDLMNMLNVTQRAIMRVAKPVAASAEGVVIGFEYDILCQRALENIELQDVLGNGLSRLLGHAPELVFIPASRWGEIRSQYLSKHDPRKKEAPKEEVKPLKEAEPALVAKAKELFGPELVKVKND